MFGRKEKQAIAALPPLHQQLLHDRALTVSLPPADWSPLLRSLAHHDDTVKRHHLPPRTTGLVVPLIAALLQDVGDDGYLGIRLDLRGSDQPGKVGPAQELAPQGRVLKCTQHTEVDPWLALEAKLADGSVLDLWVTDVVRVRKLRKRGSSGKIKYATKRKATQRVRVRLAVPADRPVRAPAAGSPGWCRVTMTRKERRVVLEARAKYPKANDEATWQLKTLLLVLGETFRWLPPQVGDGGEGDELAGAGA
ncbi:MAG: hypothetical protein R2726_10120 [Acidimicrobiales bacterium]